MNYVAPMADKFEKASRLREARTKKFPNAAAAAEALGMKASSYRAHENTQNEFYLEEAKVYGKKFGVNPYWLIGEIDVATPDSGELISAPVERREPSNATVLGLVPRSPVKIPLYGTAVGGEDGEFILNGNLLDHVFAPPSLSGIQKAYAVQISGDSMSPRYEDGDSVNVNPDRRVKTGDYVIAQIHIEEHEPPLAYVKKLKRWTDKELILEQFNPPKELRFEGDRVASVHYVLRPGE